MLNRIKAVITAAVLLGGVSASQADVIINVEQVGSNIVATGSGTINLTSLTNGSPNHFDGYIAPGVAEVVVGSSAYMNMWTILPGPKSFGANIYGSYPNSTTGDLFGMGGANMGDNKLCTPVGYVSGFSLSGSSTWNNQTYATLGVTLGTSTTWNWGTGATADSLTVHIGPAAPTAVPEPTTYALLCISLGVVGFARKKMKHNEQLTMDN